MAQAVNKYGIVGVAMRLPRYFLDDLGLRRLYLSRRFKDEQIYSNPDADSIQVIENSIAKLGDDLIDYRVSKEEFNSFIIELQFPRDYHGGKNSGVWYEKLIEHFNAYKLLEINRYDSDDIYVDVAACNSPWAALLREKLSVSAFALDLEVPQQYKAIDYYIQCDATNSPFDDNSVRGISLQCAYELFAKDDDVGLIKEMARILKPGGRALINPLYMHDHYCCYASPEYYAKGYAPEGAVEYVNIGSRGIPSSRKYDAKTLKERILNAVIAFGLNYRIYVLRNKADVSPEVYCHFMLYITKPDCNWKFNDGH